MNINEADDNELIETLANRGIDVRHITEYSMTELNNEITRRRMEAERAECANAEADADQIQEALQDGAEMQKAKQENQE